MLAVRSDSMDVCCKIRFMDEALQYSAYYKNPCRVDKYRQRGRTAFDFSILDYPGPSLRTGTEHNVQVS